MKATGIVRRIDDLGRVVIPKEIRRTMRIREGDPLEIYTDTDGQVIFKKYSPMGELSEFAAQICDALHKTTGGIAAVCDRDAVIAVAGGGKRELLDRRISRELEELMLCRLRRRAHPLRGRRARLRAVRGRARRRSCRRDGAQARAGRVGLPRQADGELRAPRDPKASGRMYALTLFPIDIKRPPGAPGGLSLQMQPLWTRAPYAADTHHDHCGGMRFAMRRRTKRVDKSVKRDQIKEKRIDKKRWARLRKWVKNVRTQTSRLHK